MEEAGVVAASCPWHVCNLMCRWVGVWVAFCGGRGLATQISWIWYFFDWTESKIAIWQRAKSTFQCPRRSTASVISTYAPSKSHAAADLPGNTRSPLCIRTSTRLPVRFRLVLFGLTGLGPWRAIMGVEHDPTPKTAQQRPGGTSWATCGQVFGRGSPNVRLLAPIIVRMGVKDRAKNSAGGDLTVVPRVGTHPIPSTGTCFH